jgi:hypothetical protein
VGDFNQTSLNFNTIRVNGTNASDTVDITGLQSEHRIVFTGNGGADNVVGGLRPQDVFVTNAAVATTNAGGTTASAAATTAVPLQAQKQAAVVAVEPVAAEAATQTHRLQNKEREDSLDSLLRAMFDDSKADSLFSHWDAPNKRQEQRVDDNPNVRDSKRLDDARFYNDSWSDALIRRSDSWHADFECLP